MTTLTTKQAKTLVDLSYWTREQKDLYDRRKDLTIDQLNSQRDLITDAFISCINSSVALGIEHSLVLKAIEDGMEGGSESPIIIMKK